LSRSTVRRVSSSLHIRAQIASGAERTACTGNDERLRIAPVAQLAHGLFDLIAHVEVERIPLVRPVQHQPSNVVFDAETNGPEGHDRDLSEPEMMLRWISEVPSPMT
jgi:hypothetical protein